MKIRRVDLTLYALPGILLLYALLAGAFALRTPDWQAPDEPAHWNYIAHIAESGCCPRLASGDWDSALLAELTGRRFAGISDAELAALRYEYHHPPLYYALAAPLFRWSDGALLALRLFSALLGAFVIWNVYRCGRLLRPERPALAALAALFAVCLPQHLHLLASVNNDALSWLLISQATLVSLALIRGCSLRRDARIISTLLLLGGIWLSLSGGETRWLGLLLALAGGADVFFLLQGEAAEARSQCWLLGCLLGLIFVSKTTAYLMLPIAILAIWLRRDHLNLSRSLFLILAPALLIGAGWWLRNLAVYGWPDFLGLIQHEQVVHGQLRTGDWLSQHGFMDYLWQLPRATFTSFWGQFGWMALPLRGWRIGFALAISFVALCGVPAAVRQWRQPAARLLIAQFALTVLVYLGYNLTFVQWQGRYLYPALIPIALLWARGALALTDRAGRHALLLQLALALSLPLFASEMIWRLLPALRP